MGVKEDAEIIVVYGGKATARAGQLFEARANSFVTNRTILWVFGQVGSASPMARSSLAAP